MPLLPKLSSLFHFVAFLAAITFLGLFVVLYFNSTYPLVSSEHSNPSQWYRELRNYTVLQERNSGQWSNELNTVRMSTANNLNTAVTTSVMNILINNSFSSIEHSRRNGSNATVELVDAPPSYNTSPRQLPSHVSVTDINVPTSLYGRTEESGTVVTNPTPPPSLGAIPGVLQRRTVDVRNSHAVAQLPGSQESSVSVIHSKGSIDPQQLVQSYLQTSEPVLDKFRSIHRYTQHDVQTSGGQEVLWKNRESQLLIQSNAAGKAVDTPLTQGYVSMPYIPPPNNLKALPVNLVASSASSQSTGKGFVLAVAYYEQQSMGSRNLFQMQCWAKHSGLTVVKPVMKDSNLRTSLDMQLQQTNLKFEDHFNLNQWNQYVEKEGYAPLVEWRDFLVKAPKKVILVQFKYSSVTLLKSRQRAGESLLHSPQGDRYKSGCDSNWPTVVEISFLKARGFTVVRRVCFNFYYGDQLTLGEFNKHLLGDLTNFNDVTVIMDMWRGFGSAQRVLIKDICSNVVRLQEYVAPSDRVIADANRYIKSYLGGGPYMAIMGRLEMSLLTTHKRVPVIPFCLQETLKQWEAFKEDVHLEKTFLSIDIGKYGTKKYRSNVEPSLSAEVIKFFVGVFGSSMTFEQWERRFVTVSHVKDAGYIGLLQKTIVTRAKCILFVGGGAFQRHALHLYQGLHPNQEEQCVRVVKPCTSATKFEL